jgi:ankyrin repeat protein
LFINYSQKTTVEQTIAVRDDATVNFKNESDKASFKEKKSKFVFILVSLIDFKISDEILESLYDASKNGDLEKVKSILSKDSSLLNEALNKYGETALYVASGYNQSSIVTFLLKEENLDVNKAIKKVNG